MYNYINQWWQNRIIKRSKFTQPQWQQAIRQLPLLQQLTQEEIRKLIQLAILFLHYKSIEGARDHQITPEMKLNIALQACLPILNLGMEWYKGWVSVIVYPAQFRPQRTFVDEYGVEHVSHATLSGESWHKGPVVLSWQDTKNSGHIDGYNLVIHEFAHKLDVLNGKTNGFPPLHRNMNTSLWPKVFSQAYTDFKQRLNSNPIPIDSYAAESPAEFFAVFSEVFFERPHIINQYYPQIYQQLALFYRQEPLSRKTPL